jgi:predicted RNA binding protein YcfA (HicA-like mRNA interferase family)
MSIQKRMREIRAMGWTVKVARGGHLVCRHPDGAGPVYLSATPSTRYYEQMVARMLRRAIRRAEQQRR